MEQIGQQQEVAPEEEGLNGKAGYGGTGGKGTSYSGGPGGRRWMWHK